MKIIQEKVKIPQYLQKVLEEIIKDERLKESRVD